MELTDFVDPYLDPETGVLRNLVGARTQQELDAIEGDIVPVRELRLEENPPERTRDLAELRSIHRFLFNAIYSWAGELRTVDIKKNLEGGSFFVPVSMIERASAYVAQELAEENFLKGLTREAFVARLAYHYDQLNYIHPFREGNGRTQRWFWGRVAIDAGWELNWINVSGAVNDAASQAAMEEDDIQPLLEMFDQVVSRDRTE